jgi:hypothetical protein
MADDPQNLLANPEELEGRIERKEFTNLIAALNAGRTPTKKQRARLAELLQKLAKRPDKDHSYVEEAVESGAFLAFKPAKSTTHEIRSRVERVIEQLRWGWPRARIVLYASKTWGVSFRQADRYINRAYVERAKWLDANRSRIEAHLLAQLGETFSLARSLNQPSQMVSAIEAAAKILGVVKPITQRMEITGAGGRPVVPPYINLPQRKPHPAPPIPRPAKTQMNP